MWNKTSWYVLMFMHWIMQKRPADRVVSAGYIIINNFKLLWQEVVRNCSVNKVVVNLHMRITKRQIMIVGAIVFQAPANKSRHFLKGLWKKWELHILTSVGSVLGVYSLWWVRITGSGSGNYKLDPNQEWFQNQNQNQNLFVCFLFLKNQTPNHIPGSTYVWNWN